MEGFGKGLAEAFGCLLTIIAILAVGFISFTVYYFVKDDAITSEHPIKPQIELVIKDNKVDTLYIYRKP